MIYVVIGGEAETARHGWSLPPAVPCAINGKDSRPSRPLFSAPFSRLFSHLHRTRPSLTGPPVGVSTRVLASRRRVPCRSRLAGHPRNDASSGTQGTT